MSIFLRKYRLFGACVASRRVHFEGQQKAAHRKFKVRASDETKVLFEGVAKKGVAKVVQKGCPFWRPIGPNSAVNCRVGKIVWEKRGSNMGAFWAFEKAGLAKIWCPRLERNAWNFRGVKNGLGKRGCPM